MGLELARAYITARGDTSRVAGDFNRGKASITTAARGIATSVQGIFASMGVMAGAAGFMQLLRSGEEFNRKMRGSLAIMGNVTAGAQQEMKAAAMEAARSSQFGAAQAAEAYYFLASAGLDARQSIAALPQVTLFAQAGMFDLGRATDLATDAQSALGMTVKDPTKNLENLTRVTDVLVKANTLANASVEQFSLAMTSKAGAAARIVGKDVEELAAILAAFADQGVKAQEAGTAVNIVLRDLQTQAINNKQAFKDAGVTVFDTSGNMRNMADIVGDLEKRLEGMSAEGKKMALMQLGFSDKSVIFMQTLIGTSGKIREYEKELRKAGGTTKEVADKQLTPMQKGMAEVGAALTELASAFMKVIGPIVELIGKNMKLIMTIGGLVAGFFALKMACAAVGMGMMNPLLIAIVAVGVALVALSGGFKEAASVSVNYLAKGDALRKSHIEQFHRLEELAKKQNLTDIEMEEAGNIISTLRNHYGDLGIVMDQVTGQIEIQQGAWGRMTEVMRTKRIRDINNELNQVKVKFAELDVEMEGGFKRVTAAGYARFTAMRHALVELQASLTLARTALEKGKGKLTDEKEESLPSVITPDKTVVPEMTDAGKSLRDMARELFDLTVNTMDLTDAQKEVVIWTSQYADATQEEIDSFRKMRSEMKMLQDQLDKKAMGEALTKSLMTPLENAREELRNIRSLWAGFTITPETAQRALDQLKDKLTPKIEFAVTGRVGFAEFGRSIQDALLKPDDPQKKTAKNTADMKVLLDEIKREGIVIKNDQLVGTYGGP